MMWPGHGEEFDMDTSRMANVLHAHVPLAMSLCHVDYVKMQSSLQNHMYNPGAYEGILELRKEKSRDAARSRRGKENYEFYELAKLLPLPAAITSQLDKASIIRLTISYLKLRDFSGHGDPPWNREEQNLSKSLKSIPSVPSQCRSTLNLVQDVFESHQGTHILQSLDGFAFALSNDARFLYISETVSIYLGLSQVEMAGSSIFEYIHSHDHKELAEQLGLSVPKPSSSFSSPSGTSDEGSSSTPNPPRSTTPVLDRVSVMSPNPSTGYDRCFCIRMKSTLTKRGVHFKSSGYRVVQIVAHLRPQYSYPSSSQKQLPPLLGLVGMAIALPPPTITELIIDNDMFITRLSPQFKITYCEPRLSDMMDISSEDLLNKSLYDFCHAEDLRKLNKAHSDLLNKGQVLTDYYRLMNKHGGYVWIQTCATIICNAKNVDDQNIIAINYVLSGIEYSGCVMSVEQYKAVNKTDHEISEPTSEAEFSRNDKSTYQPLGPNMSANEMNQFTRNGIKTSFYDKMPTFEDRSPTENKLQHSEEVNSFSLHESKDLNDMKSCLKSTPKSTRRKMEKPRKRKRGSCDDPKSSKLHSDVNESLPNVNDNVSPDKTDDSGMFVSSKGPNFQKNDEATKATSKSHGSCGLENRSSKQKSKTSENSSNRNLSSNTVAKSSNVCPALESVEGRKNLPENSAEAPSEGVWIDKVSISTCSSENYNSAQSSAKNRQNKSCDKDGGDANATESDSQLVEVFPVKKNQLNLGATVHDLEAAMNKHLPASSSFTSSHQLFTSGYFHSGMLGIPKSKPSTIQWIGGGSLMGQPCVSNYHADLSLLRSLYPGRESVIRSNVYSQGRLQSHQQLQYYQPEAQPPQLTPPGGDTFQQTSSSSYSKTSGTTGGFSPYISYNAHGLSEGYSVTPPSSVSPQDPPLYAPLQLFDHLQNEQTVGFAAQAYARDSSESNSSQLKAPVQSNMPGSHYGNYDHYYYHHQTNFNPSYNGHGMSMVPYNPYMSGGPVNGPHLESMKNLW